MNAKTCKKSLYIQISTISVLRIPIKPRRILTHNAVNDFWRLEYQERPKTELRLEPNG